jgi:chlorite dismutase
MSEGGTKYVHALALGLDPAWRRLPAAERAADADAFVSIFESFEGITRTYSMIGIEVGADILVWRLVDSPEALEEAAAGLLRTGMGRWLTPRNSFVGLIGDSQYVARPTRQEQSLFEGDPGKYLIVYPFTKSTDWYLLSSDVRQGVMNGHIKVGHRYPQVRQLLAYSFGLDDQDFIVAYETDDLPAFGALVRELRGTESRRATVQDTPILAAIRRTPREIVDLLGAADGRAVARVGTRATATAAANELDLAAIPVEAGPR